MASRRNVSPIAPCCRPPCCDFESSPLGCCPTSFNVNRCAGFDPIVKLSGRVTIAQRQSDAAVRGGIVRHRAVSMDKTISGHLDAERHRRVVIKSREVHAMLFAGSKPPVGRAAVVFAAADMALKDQSIPLVSAQHLVCLVDLDPFKVVTPRPFGWCF